MGGSFSIATVLCFDDLLARADVGGVATFDKELETRRVGLDDLGWGGMIDQVGVKVFVGVEPGKL